MIVELVAEVEVVVDVVVVVAVAAADGSTVAAERRRRCCWKAVVAVYCCWLSSSLSPGWLEDERWCSRPETTEACSLLLVPNSGDAEWIAAVAVEIDE